MRWTRLFDDLEAQLVASEQAELAGEISEQTRSERSRIELADRLGASRGHQVRVRVAGLGSLDGVVTDSAASWFVLSGHAELGPPQVTLVRTGAVLALTGLSFQADVPGPGRVRRLDLGQALRALSRDRAVVHVHDVSGGSTTGTIDRVGRDHVDIGTHPADLSRRTADLRGTAVVPFEALSTVTYRG